MGVIETNTAGLSPNRSSKQIHKSMYFSDLDGLLHRCLFSVPGSAPSLTESYRWRIFQAKSGDRGQERKRKGNLHDPVVVPRYDHFHGHDSGTDWLEVPTIYVWPIFQAYVREYPHNIWPYMVLTNLHFRILEFPLIILDIIWYNELWYYLTLFQYHLIKSQLNDTVIDFVHL
jgi:hypothetical protein